MCHKTTVLDEPNIPRNRNKNSERFFLIRNLDLNLFFEPNRLNRDNSDFLTGDCLYFKNLVYGGKKNEILAQAIRS